MTSLDGRQVEGTGGPLQRTASPFSTVGAPGTAIYGGFIVENEKDARLTGREKYRTYSDILANTTIVAAGVRFFLNIIAKAGWTVEPADDSPQAEEIAEQLESIMYDMTTPWHRVVRRTAMGRFYGFSVQEWTAKRNEDGTIGYLDLEPRPQVTIERWDTDESGTVRGIVQREPQGQQEIYLPRGKCVYFVDDTLNDSPEGMGLFRHLVKTAKKLERYEILEAWGFERDLRGIPVGYGPLSEMQQLVNKGDLTQADANALRDPIEKFLQNALKGKDTALFLDSAVYRSTGEQQTPSSTKQWEVELLSGEGQSNGQEEAASAIERLNREMARVLGVEQLLLGSDSAGSFALSKDKTQSFGLLVEGTLREIRETYEKDFIDPLFALNGWDESLKPSFKTETVQYRDIEQITSALRDMAQAGGVLAPDDPAINEIRDLLGLSHQPEMLDDLDLGGQPTRTPTVPSSAGEDEALEAEDEGEGVAKLNLKPGPTERRADFLKRAEAAYDSARNK